MNIYPCPDVRCSRNEVANVFLMEVFRQRWIYFRATMQKLKFFFLLCCPTFAVFVCLFFWFGLVCASVERPVTF